MIANFIGELTVVSLLATIVYLETTKGRTTERARKEALEVEMEKLGKEVAELKKLLIQTTNTISK